jgi:hypothetical protein
MAIAIVSRRLPGNIFACGDVTRVSKQIFRFHFIIYANAWEWSAICNPEKVNGYCSKVDGKRP